MCFIDRNNIIFVLISIFMTLFFLFSDGPFEVMVHRWTPTSYMIKRSSKMRNMNIKHCILILPFVMCTYCISVHILFYTSYIFPRERSLFVMTWSSYWILYNCTLGRSWVILEIPTVITLIEINPRIWFFTGDYNNVIPLFMYSNRNSYSIPLRISIGPPYQRLLVQCSACF